MKAIIAAILLATGVSASAGELSLQLHGFSKHAAPRPGSASWNEKNYGLGLRYQIDEDWGVQGGFYKNSINNDTVYLLGQWTPVHMGPVAVGAFGGLATGYLGDVPLIGGFMANIGGLTVRVVPRVKGMTPTVVAVEYGIKF
jgi:hypothetical protein